MGEVARVDLSIPEIVARTGVTHPNVPPHENVTFVAVAWNEELRMKPLLQLAQKWFAQCVIGVQESDDRTFEIAVSMKRDLDRVVREPHHGHGDASMKRLIRLSRTPWVLVVALDERPSKALLESIGNAVVFGDQEGIDAFWVRFMHITEGIRGTDTQAGHLRLFRRELDWPQTMHSRPSGEKERMWPYGRITHRRSLDEMIRDYLRIYRLGKGKQIWEDHNILMMHDACEVIADHYGWDKVTAYEWWPEVRDLAFAGKEPNG